ncbi:MULTISPECIES: hypothetical protein [unclassified Ruegeria]|uniref:hypothetical protein n=1 Tax=unclassified Ruegeria TaxID=2625375 RepID=UPI001487E003|nr:MULTISPECIES: hypothetical protein [unclassified Ruegeria]NOD85909.1 hypothetical protein [Ruegeria sp. HKCCD6119]
MTPETLSVKRRRFLYFYVAVLAISSVILFTGFLLKALFADPQQALVTEVWDGIIFETAVFIGATIAGAALVALIIDHHQQRLGAESDELKTVIEQEGLLGVYQDANDPKLIARLIEAISGAHREFYAFGLGLGILFNNRSILQRLSEQINQNAAMSATILTGSGTNPGVANRIEEEKSWHESKNINYNVNWADNFPAEISTSLANWVNENSRSRVKVETVDSCFMFGAIVVDDVVFLFPYGSPDVRGSESPWYELVYKSGSEGKLASFVRRCVSYYKKN